jgi:hypothetical protein
MALLDQEPGRHEAETVRRLRIPVIVIGHSSRR